jgi:phosphohistidine phosphatase SixA
MSAYHRTILVAILVVIAPALSMGPAAAQAPASSLSGPALINALRRGGYVIVMRHASSPRDAPDARTANRDNTSRERQLDEAGRSTAMAMGEALKRLGISFNLVFTSPTYRALETVRLLGIKNNVTPINELGDGGASMRAATDAQSRWLQDIVTRVPMGNTLVVTHMPNIARAFPQLSDVVDGESLIYQPDANGGGGTHLVARVKIDEWPTLRR